LKRNLGRGGYWGKKVDPGRGEKRRRKSVWKKQSSLLQEEPFGKTAFFQQGGQGGTGATGYKLQTAIA